MDRRCARSYVFILGMGLLLAPRIAGAQEQVDAAAADPGKPTITILSADTGAPLPTEQRQRELKARLQQDQSDFEAAQELGNLYYDLGLHVEAEEFYRQVLQIRPEHVPALVNLGVVLNDSGRSEQAIEFFDRALAVRPGDVVALCNKGQALYAMNKYDQAVRLYTEAIRLDPQSQLAYYWLGIAFADAGIYREAIREWEKVVEIDPASEYAATARDGLEVLRKLVP